MSQHFRNLLVCKDATTLDLLEEADNVKTKYKAQAEEITDSFLMTAINIASQSDLSYKESRNQRLHVELALMKMAHIPSAIFLAKHPVEQQANPPEALKKKLA